MNDKGFADRLDALLSEYDVDEQERILRYALDHVVPRMKGRATAEQPAEPKPVDHDAPGPTPGFPKTSRDWLEAIIDIDDDRQQFDEGDGQYVVGSFRDAIEEARKHLAATAPAPVAPTDDQESLFADVDATGTVVLRNDIGDILFYAADGKMAVTRIGDECDDCRERTLGLAEAIADRWNSRGELPAYLQNAADIIQRVALAIDPAPAAPVAPDAERNWEGYEDNLLADSLGESHPSKPAAPVAEVLTALDAGDGALHGAIDYWQNRALAAEAGRDADETNAVLASNYIALCARLESAGVLTDAQIDAVTEAQWGRQPVGAMLSAHRAFARAIIAAMSAAPPAPAKVLTDRDIDGLLHALNSHARHYGDEYGLPCDAPHELSHMRKLVRYHIAAMAASSAPEGKAT